MSISIKPATEKNASAINDCVQSAYAHYESRMGQKPGPMLQDYAQVIREHRVYVAHQQTDTEQICGAVVLIDQADGILLDNVAVAPTFQGKGIGKALIAFAELTARELGYTNIQLYTHESMTENIAMYQAIGYAEFDRRTEHGFKRVYMRKNLDC